ncbi:MAG: hypothetical protein E6J77_00490 [Deltaproteobacteria bacterium]|nr:MAG: hypothetical protein E6J77_00490 [Deltaproteobacteria bacterium]
MARRIGLRRVDTLLAIWLRTPLPGGRAVDWHSIVFIVVAGIAVVVLVTLTLVRRRRARRRALEARRRERETRRLSAIEATGVLGLAATIEGVRLAVRVGTELACRCASPT